MFKEQLVMALDSLRANKFRSLLTMLASSSAPATLVAVLSLGNAVQGPVFEQFIDLGTRHIAVLPGDPKARGARDVPGYGLLSNPGLPHARGPGGAAAGSVPPLNSANRRAHRGARRHHRRADHPGRH